MERLILDQHEMIQIIVNAIILGLLGAVGFITKVIWEGVRELQREDLKLAADIATVRLMMADSYIKKEDFDRLAKAIFEQLRRIEDKLDHKADRSDK